MKSKYFVILLFVIAIIGCSDYSFRDPFENSDFPSGWDYYKTYEFDKAITTFSNNISLGVNLAESYAGIGWAYLHKNQIDKAILNFQSSLSNDSNYSDSQVGLGIAYMLSDIPDSAKIQLANCLSVNPQFRIPDTHYEIDNLSNKDIKKMMSVLYLISGEFANCADIVNISGQTLPNSDSDFDYDSWNLLLDLVEEYEKGARK